jgi:hypothetical protein
MSDLWLERIERERGTRQVVLVEGRDDVVLLGHFLSQHDPAWDARLYLTAAEGKRRVVQGVSVHRPDWIGIIDRDEWSPADIQDALERTERLKILPRFCIESYFCVPGELWTALPAADRQKVDDDFGRLSQPILADLADWMAHGAMWRVLRARRQDLLSGLGFPAELENRPVTDPVKIRAILQTWHDHLKPDDILDAYQAELQEAQKLPEEEQLKDYVHGKRFFNQVVVQCLDALFSGKGRGYWLQRFRDTQIQPPTDLTALFDEILGLI